MITTQVGRNDPWRCGSGKKFKNCCLPPRANTAPPGYTVFVSPSDYFQGRPRPQLRLRSADLPPFLKGKVFRPEARAWEDAQLKEVGPGREFVADNRFFKILDRHMIAECHEIDVTKLADADCPFDPGNWRHPRPDDVVYIPGEVDLRTGHCLLSNVKTYQRFRFQGRFYFLQPGREPGSLELIDTGRVDGPENNDDSSPQVWLEYTIEDPLGKAEVGYRYPVGRLVILPNRDVRPVQELAPGMHFVVETGDIALVTKVEYPKPPLERPAEHNEYGVAPRGVQGTYKFTGSVQLMDVTWGGEVHRMTPGHLFWSESRRGWHPIGSFRVGELLRSHDRHPVPVQAIGPVRWVHETVYNYEVDEYHTYFVGKFGVWSHNGMGDGCSVPRAARAEALEDGAVNVTSARGAGVTRPQRHHIFPQARRSWFKQRGVDIDRYTLPLDEGTHQALHYGGGPGKGGGWWNDTIMQRLTSREAALGRQLTPREILQIGAGMRRRAGLTHVKVISYHDP
jgi:hypothetical protein